MGQTPYRTDSSLDMAEVTIIYLVKMEWMKERHEEEKFVVAYLPLHQLRLLSLPLPRCLYKINTDNAWNSLETCHYFLYFVWFGDAVQVDVCQWADRSLILKQRV